MGLIFDARSANLYESWYRSSSGRVMDKFVEESISTLVNPLPGERILDVGCGEGNHLRLFDKLGLNASGVDASPYMIRRARGRVGGRSTLKVGRAEDLPFDDNEFELAFFINTLEFLDDPLAAMREAGRVARRGVFFGVMNSLSWYGLSAKAQGLFRKSFFDHITFYNLWELRAHAKAAFGAVPMTWRCTRIGGPLMERLCSVLFRRWYLEHCPFGPFLGLYATMQYRMMTEQRPLRVGLKEAAPSALRGLTIGRTNCGEGVRRHERSLFV